MRNPNGYGSVVYLGKSRRLPYGVRKTVKFELNGESCTQKYKYFGYYATKREAMIALAKLNQRKLDASAADYTFGEMFEEWHDRHSRNLEESSAKKLKSIFKNYCSGLAGVSIVSVTEAAMQEILDGCERGYQTQIAIKQVLQGVMSYTQSRGLRVDDPSAMLIAGGDQNIRPHKVFSMRAQAEMKNDPLAWSIYFLLYSGMRIEELLRVKIADININEQYLIGGIKSKAGKQRVIPIHRFLVPLVKARLGQTYLVEMDGGRLSYKNYRSQIWDPIMKKYGHDYTPHDTRHTFMTAMHRAGVSDFYIQKIVGHTAKNTAHSVYTHTEPAELVAEINRLK